MKSSSEILIIGAGIIGLTTAFRLLKNGAKVILFDSGRCGEGATGASLGAMWPPSPTKEGPYYDFFRSSFEEWEEFSRELKDHSGIDVSFKRVGSYEILNSASQLKAAESEILASKAKSGIWKDQLDYINSDDSLRVLEGLKSSQCGAIKHGAISCNLTSKVDVSLLVNALYKSIINLGGKIFEHTKVSEIITEGEIAKGVITKAAITKAAITNGEKLEKLDSKDLVSCDQILVSAGHGSNQLHPILDQCAPIYGVKGEALLIDKDFGLNKIIKRKPIYLVPFPNGQLAIGATTVKGDTSLNPTDSSKEFLLKSLNEISDRIVDAKVVKHWVGIRPVTVHRKPYLGRVPSIKNLFIATGHYKTAFSLAPGSARYMAELMLRDQKIFDLCQYEPKKADSF